MTVQAYAIVAMEAGSYFGITATVGEVVNIVLWDGGSDWTPPAGTEAKANADGSLQIGQTTTI